MTAHDVQRFVHVFSLVDTDQDGKITGEQARQLFLSWQLPREVLRRVWNLSDQDGDSMLSVGEFCTAVYLLEKYTEGRPLPSRLPAGIHLDESPTPDKEILPPSFEHLGSALATTPTPHLQYSLSAVREPAESSGGESYNPQLISHADTNLRNQNRKSKEDSALPPTLIESGKLVKQVANLNKHMLSQKEKAEYYRSKLQEIMYSLSRQCDEKTKSISEVETQTAAELATLHRIQEKKIELSQSLRLDRGSTQPDSYLQIQLDLIALDLDKLGKILTERAKSLGVEIKQGLPKKSPFGWQPNIQEKAAEWQKDWDNLNDEGYTEVKECIGATPEASVLATSTGELSAAASRNAKGENALEFDIINCGIHCASSEKDSLIFEAPAAATVSKTTSGAWTGELINFPANCISKSTNEASTENAMQISSNYLSKSNAEALTIDAVDTYPRIILEHKRENLTKAEVNSSALIVPPSEFFSRAENASMKMNMAAKATARSEVGSSTQPHPLNGNLTPWRVEQNECALQASLGPESHSRSIQTPAVNKASGGATGYHEKRGSFEPGDYFDLTLPSDFSIRSETIVSSTMAHEQNENKERLSHNNSEPFSFKATHEES